MMDTIFETVGDGDTLIVSTAIQYTKKQDNEVVVIANDTNILVLLIYHWQKSMKLFMHSEVTKKNGREKQTWKIEDVALAVGNGIARHNLFMRGLVVIHLQFINKVHFISIVQFSLFIMITYKSLFYN